MRSDNVKNSNPNFYVCVDRAFFDIDISVTEDRELLSTFMQLRQFPSLLCFFPLDSKHSFCERYGLDRNLNIQYFSDLCMMTERYRGCFDLRYTIPGFGTVVQYAIAIAIYMGFNEIYLLGCDNSGLVNQIFQAMDKANECLYAYEVTDGEARRMNSLLERVSLEECCQSYLTVLQGYRILNRYCDCRNIKLINCSSQTCIDNIPRMSLETVLK